MRLRLGVCAVVVLAPVPALAAPTVLATARADVDADGAADDIRLTPDGVVVAASAGRAEVTFGLALKHGTLTAGGPWIAVEAETDRGAEGVGLRWKAGGLSVVWRGRIGPVGVDGDYRVDLTATADGLVRHHSRADVRRCDGKPALLFAEGWDETRRAFRAIRLKAAVDAAAPTLHATRVTDAAPPRPVAFTAQAASTSAGVTDAGGLAAPRELDDGDVTTAWREDKGGDGRGEFFTYRAIVHGQSARALWIAPGGTDATNRPTRLAVVGADRAYWVEVPDDRAAGGAAYRVDLPEPIGDCVSVVIGEVKKGKGAAGGGTTTIAELVVLGDADLAPGGAEAALVGEVARGGAGVAGATDMLLRRGASGATAIMTALGGAQLSREARLRLVRVLIRGRAPVAAAAIASAITTDLTGPDVDDATRALAAMGAAAVPALASLAEDTAQSTEARAAALAALGDIPGDDATLALVAAAGNGPRPVRLAVTRALGKRPVRELLAVPAPAAAAAAADRLRGLGLAGQKATTADRATALAALSAALAAATDYEARYRSIQGVAALGDATALGALDRALAALGTGGDAGALHQVAALALARNPADAAGAILVRLAGHADPGVRLRAITALAERPAAVGTTGANDDATDRVLADVLAGDHWPELRRAAAGSLGTRCQRPAPARALDAAVDHDRELEVRGDALAGLVACKATGIADRLIAIAIDGEAPLPLRERAVLLVAALDDKRLEAPLIELFERFRGGAYDSPEALALAARAAAVLGRIGGPRAAAVLEAALADEALPELVASVAAGLGALGQGCPRTAAARLRELARSDNQTIAASARRAAARCGK